jgi:antitoxin component HigA of HigAB toxin-antitoxin module
VIDSLTSTPKLSRGQTEYLELLSVLFSDYESKHHAVKTSDLTPVDVLKALMDEHGMIASDLGRLLGERSLGANICNGDRALSKSHIRKLAEHFGIRGDLFL